MIINKNSYFCCPHCKTILYKTRNDVNVSPYSRIRANDFVDTSYNNIVQPYSRYLDTCWSCGYRHLNLSDLTVINNLYYS